MLSTFSAAAMINTANVEDKGRSRLYFWNCANSEKQTTCKNNKAQILHGVRLVYILVYPWFEHMILWDTERYKWPSYLTNHETYELSEHLVEITCIAYGHLLWMRPSEFYLGFMYTDMTIHQREREREARCSIPTNCVIPQMGEREKETT